MTKFHRDGIIGPAINWLIVINIRKRDTNQMRDTLPNCQASHRCNLSGKSIKRMSRFVESAGLHINQRTCSFSPGTLSPKCSLQGAVPLQQPSERLRQMPAGSHSDCLVLQV